MAPERQKAKGTSAMRSKSKGCKGRGVSSSRSSASGLRATRPQDTILRYLQSSSPLPVASERRTSPREASSGTLRSDLSSASSNTEAPVATSTASPQPLSSSSSRRSNVSPSIDESSGNARSRRGRHLDERPSSRSPVRQHYGGKEYIPDSIDDDIAGISAPDRDMSLNDQSLAFSPDIQMDPADEDDRSWHIRSTPPRSHEPCPDGTINRANNDQRETVITRSEHPLSEAHDKERAERVTAELPTRQEIYNWVEEEDLDEGEKLARRIVYILNAGLVSCPLDRHKDQDASHLATCRRHLHLRETWAGSSARVSGLSFTEREEQSRHFGLDRTIRPLDASVTGLRRDQLPPASRLEAQFAGWHEDKEWSDAEVCLHQDDVPQRKLAPAVHDIDSFLHVTKDPRSLRGPLNICITAQPSLLLSKSIHVRVPIRVGEKIKQVPIYQIPHTVLAH
ncbi:hypothetical protein FNYG_15949 [Fusarium nygamai]|uniref:Uncharacterized protein n=1 Tax=Gibberella nygamai TaxID=42673 RepID=A0A2K0TYK0_GIBNY|nr:hypothetical protein FNYG_15949 [Fusarium nygamai]